MIMISFSHFHSGACSSSWLWSELTPRPTAIKKHTFIFMLMSKSLIYSARRLALMLCVKDSKLMG